MIFKALDNVDWELLRIQKGYLTNIMLGEPRKTLSPDHLDALDGIIALIDNIQDEASETLGVKHVFGEFAEE